MKEFRPIMVTDVLGFIDVLISFWGQKVKGQGHHRLTLCRNCGMISEWAVELGFE